MLLCIFTSLFSFILELPFFFSLNFLPLNSIEADNKHTSLSFPSTHSFFLSFFFLSFLIYLFSFSL